MGGRGRGKNAFRVLPIVSMPRDEHVMSPLRHWCSNCSWTYVYRPLALVCVIFVLYSLYGGRKRILVDVDGALDYSDRGLSEGLTDSVYTAIPTQALHKDILPIWPMPKQMLVEDSKGQSISLSDNLRFKTAASSTILKDVIKRYKTLISSSRQWKCSLSQVVEINTIVIVLKIESEAVNIDTNYDYELIMSTETKDATIVANSPFGAMYGLETLSQVFFNRSCIPYSHVYIKDHPSYRHRGFLLDVARRQAPKELVFTILDALSYLKMNVLHLHLSDNCKFSLQMEQFPQLTNYLKNDQFFTKKDVKDIIEYARQRGIRVIPEIDLPGHARGLKILNGEHLEFCDDNFKQIYNDPQGKSIKTLKKFFTELINVFTDQYVHMGGDETSTDKICTQKGSKALETEIAEHILSLNRTPIAWEEAIFRTGVGVPGMVTETWKDFRPADAAKKGYNSINAQHLYFYLDIKPRWESYEAWTDIDPSDKHVKSEGLLGGELAMWTDSYRKGYNCEKLDPADKEHPIPIAHWMFEPEYDEEFSISMMGMIWPNAIPGAGSFWNYDETLQDSTYRFLINHIHQVMISRGIKACPIGCSCDEVQRCGVKYHGP